MHQTEDFGLGRVLQDGLETALVVVHVFIQLSAFNIKDIDQHLYVPKDIVSLTGKIVFHEGFLSANNIKI
jgi:hypothetical protein